MVLDGFGDAPFKETPRVRCLSKQFIKPLDHCMKLYVDFS